MFQYFKDSEALELVDFYAWIVCIFPKVYFVVSNHHHLLGEHTSQFILGYKANLFLPVVVLVASSSISVLFCHPL